MAYNYEYPYTDAQRYNDDWLINKVKELAMAWLQTSGEWTQTQEAWEELRSYITDYFNNLDVQEEINEKLEAMKADGSLFTIIRPLFDEYQQSIDVLSARMDTFTALGDNATTGDAELADIRVDYTGHTWPNAGDAVRGVTGQLSSEIEAIINSLQKTDGEMTDITTSLLFSTNGGLLPNGTIGTYNGWGVTDYIDVSGYYSIEFNVTTFNTPTIKVVPIAFYDSDKTFISSVLPDDTRLTQWTGSGDVNTYISYGKIEIPTNAKYVRIGNYEGTGSIQSYDDYYVHLYEVSYVNPDANEWNGKVCAFLGDSITEGVGTSAGNIYFDYLAEKLGIIPHGYGQNGAQLNSIYGQAIRMYEELGDSVDCIFVFGGTNNFTANTPIGEWYAESTEDNTMVRSFIEDFSTFRGSLNKVLSYLKHTFPTKQIIIMTPIHRGYANFGSTNIQNSELYQNGIGLYFEEYVNSVKEAGDIWSVEIIDLYKCSGLFPIYDEYTQYFANANTDRLHPNARGHKRLSDVIASKLKSITCNLD